METHPTVVYVPTSGTPSNSQDKLLEYQISRVRENRIRERSIQTDTILDLPTQIAISKDGEEGYIESQKQLMFKYSRYLDHVFRPPPNKTVNDRKSPAPYCSSSSSIENLGSTTSSARISSDSNCCMRVTHCYSKSTSVSSENGIRTPPQRVSEAKTHHRTLSTNTPKEVERIRTVSARSFFFVHKTNCGRTPDYSGVFYSETRAYMYSIHRVSPDADSTV